jgi:hypothetical protein
MYLVPVVVFQIIQGVVPVPSLTYRDLAKITHGDGDELTILGLVSCDSG